MSLVSLTDLIKQENARSRGRPSKARPAPPPDTRSPLDARFELGKLVSRLGLRKAIPQAHITALAERLRFPTDATILFQVGGEVVFILSAQHKEQSDDELAALFREAAPNLVYRRKSRRGDNPKELSTLWVYLALEPPERRLPDYDYGWQFRQSLWSFL